MTAPTTTRPTTFTTAVIGASGYAGGELLRLLLDHPHASVVAATSRTLVGEPIHRAHPNLRARTDLLFSPPQEAPDADVIFLCLPPSHAAADIDQWLSKARVVIDLSSDFRLRDPALYRAWYGADHPNTGRLDAAVYGLPELTRDRLRGARLVSGVGCNATAMILALLPLARAGGGGLVDRVICDIKVGSSEGGADPGPDSHHPERSGALRSYAPAGHRHAAEVIQALGIPESRLDVAITAVEMVRGVLCTAHVIPTRTVDIKELWRLYRGAYAHEPFVRLVAERTGMHRLPDPKILAGSNFADVGFDIDPRTGRIVAISAIDNLMKGAAGSALQCMNLALGLDERAGLSFPGLHPV